MSGQTVHGFIEGVEVRSGQGGGASMLGGYAALFNQEAIINGPDGTRWRERVSPTAFVDTLGRDDVLAAVNHSIDHVLGRTKNGSLILSTDAHGLRYDVKLPNTSLARDTVENIRAGVLAGSSFRFIIPEPGDLRVVKEHGRSRNDLLLVMLERIHLLDVGPVVMPAYEGTSVSARNHAESIVALVQQAREDDDARSRRCRLRSRIRIEQAKAWGM